VIYSINNAVRADNDLSDVPTVTLWNDATCFRMLLQHVSPGHYVKRKRLRALRIVA